MDATVGTNDDGPCTLFLGDSGCGKSSLIQSFLKPTSTKEPKSTFALEYNFARRSKGSSSSSSSNDTKLVSHIWELGGDMYESKLLEIPITSRNLSNCSIVIVCDLSKPRNILSSLLRWINVAKEIVNKRISDVKAVNAAIITTLKENCMSHYKESKDASRVKPFEVPLYIILNKFDVYKTYGATEKKLLLQVVRFVGHYYGASIFTSSISDITLKESFRMYCSNIVFCSSMKSMLDINIDRSTTITAGRDDFESILLGGSVGSGSNSDSMSQYLSSSGVTRDCWTRFGDQMKAAFGASDSVPDQSLIDNGTADGNKDENEFPEIDIDNVRAQRDALLVRYLQEAERKELMLLKMNSTSNNSDSKDIDEGSKSSSRSRKK